MATTPKTAPANARATSKAMTAGTSKAAAVPKAKGAHGGARAGAGRKEIIFDQAVADELCAWIASGKSQRKWCAQPGKPGMDTISKWRRQNDDFSASLMRAREDWTHSILDEVQDIADDGSNDTSVDEDGVERVNSEVVARSKLRAEMRLRMAAMVNPHRYGQKVDLTVKQAPPDPDEVEQRLQALLAKAAGNDGDSNG